MGQRPARVLKRRLIRLHATSHPSRHAVCARTTALRGGFNWSLQHIPQTCLLGFDRARSFWAFH
jgi:hypothetical protein